MLANLITALTQLITNLYAVTGVFGIMLAMAIESCCIPLPSEIVMPLAGVMIANGTILKGTNPILAIFLVALAGAIGCLIGSTAAYGIGYKGGRPLMLKYGRYVLISQHDADKADAFFQRWGSATAFVSRLLPVVRTYISLPAGIAKMPFWKFCAYSFLGSLPWCLLLAYGGYVLGGQMDKLSPIFHALDVVILVVVVLLIVLYVWRHVRNDRKARAEHAAVEALELQASMQNAQQPAQPQYAQSQQGWVQPQQPQQGWVQPQPPQQQFQAQPPQPPQWGQPPQTPQAPQKPWPPVNR